MGCGGGRCADARRRDGGDDKKQGAGSARHGSRWANEPTVQTMPAPAPQPYACVLSLEARDPPCSTTPHARMCLLPFGKHRHARAPLRHRVCLCRGPRRRAARSGVLRDSLDRGPAGRGADDAGAGGGANEGVLETNQGALTFGIVIRRVLWAVLRPQDGASAWQRDVMVRGGCFAGVGRLEARAAVGRGQGG